MELNLQGNVFHTIKYLKYENRSPYYTLSLFVGDDEHGINMANLVNMVDESLLKYDVDTKSCMARTMCNQYAQRMLQGEEEAVQRMSRGIIENIAQ